MTERAESVVNISTESWKETEKNARLKSINRMSEKRTCLAQTTTYFTHMRITYTYVSSYKL